MSAAHSRALLSNPVVTTREPSELNVAVSISRSRPRSIVTTLPVAESPDLGAADARGDDARAIRAEGEAVDNPPPPASKMNRCVSRDCMASATESERSPTLGARRLAYASLK